MTDFSSPEKTIHRNMASTNARIKSEVPLLRTGYLFTPPENLVDSFTSEDDKRGAEQAVEAWRKTPLPLSVQTPPASPEFRDVSHLSTTTGYSTQDSLLFPQTQSDRTQPQLPLFEKERSVSHPPSPRPATVTISTAGSQTNQDDSTWRPKSFPGILNIRTGQDALRYYKARMDEVDRMKKAKLPTPTKSSSWNLDKESSRQLQSLSRPAGITKPRSAARTATKPQAVVATSPTKVSPPRRRTPKARTVSDFVDSAFPARESSTKHKRAPPSKKVEGENVVWTDLPDYAPPSSDLDTNSKTLKVTWHGHALHLEDDPDRHELHEQEIQVASILRLSCETYLTNKRKIFQGRLQSIKDGKNFTKTAAQSACKIDVNKASQLWEAFDRVGWFNHAWYEKFL